MRRVWLFAVPGSDLLDVGGPWDVLGHANHVLGRTAYEMELFAPAGSVVRTRHGLRLHGARALPRTVERPPAIAIVAGGAPGLPVPVPELRLAQWLRRHRTRIRTLVSICTGAFVLGEAGLLDGRTVTTHWRFTDSLRARFPRARVVDEGIFIRDGRLWTSAGITAGIDLVLALVEADHGHSVAMAVAKELVLFLRRSGHQAQFSATLRRQHDETGRPRDISTYVMEHLDEPLSVERVARGIGTSARSLTRWCRDQLGESPAQLVQRLRVEEARRLLEDTDLPLKAISARTGLGDASTLWRAFARRLGVTPAAYRERFTARSTPRSTLRRGG
jgi:transcriptional regulator GlxA family with amidase domain